MCDTVRNRLQTFVIGVEKGMGGSERFEEDTSARDFCMVCRLLCSVNVFREEVNTVEMFKSGFEGAKEVLTCENLGVSLLNGFVMSGEGR